MFSFNRSLIAGLIAVGAVLPCQAANSGTISFHAYGNLPTSDVTSSLDLEYLTCENKTAKISLESANDWRPLRGPIDVEWPAGDRCDVSVVVDTQRMGTHYFGSAVCEVLAGSAVACEINICKQTENGVPICN